MVYVAALFDQLIHNDALLECRPSLKQMLLKLAE